MIAGSLRCGDPLVPSRRIVAPPRTHPPGVLRTAAHRTIVAERRGPGVPQEGIMSHQPPKESKKKPQHTPKEKKAIKQQKRHASDTVPFIKT